MLDNSDHAVLARVDAALQRQREYLVGYEKPAEPLAYETIRAFDDIFVRDLMLPFRRVDQTERAFRNISGWGVNQALRRVVPSALEDRPFRDFASTRGTQEQANDFVFGCGALAIAERCAAWLRDGSLKGERRPYPKTNAGGQNEIVILRSASPSYLDEDISIQGLRWVCNMQVSHDNPLERALEQQYLDLEPELQPRVELINGWHVRYSSTPEIDRHFLDWARLYLRRIFSQDILGPRDVIGGRPFSRYVDVLTALSARSQRHVAFAAILKRRHDQAHVRNLLTTHCDREELIGSIARELDADGAEIAAILQSFILTGSNLEAHTCRDASSWAPLVQASANRIIFPVFGLDINPFLFLMADLRNRYESDWFEAANKREGRWVDQLNTSFAGPEWRTCGRSIKLRKNGRVLTDIDYAVFQPRTNELALFQLKWQHPVGLDTRTGRSAGKNLMDGGNKWVEAVMTWLETYGPADLLHRMDILGETAPRTVHLFVLGRYHAFLTGLRNHDPRAVWADWAHFQQVLLSGNATGLSQIATLVEKQVGESRSRKQPESQMFPIGDIALVINPTSVPDSPG